MTPAPDPAAIRAWLDRYAGVPGYVTAPSAPHFRAECFSTDATALDRAADHMARKAGTADTYLNCCTLAQRPTSGRGGAQDTAATVAVWADLDVAGAGHRLHSDPGCERRLPTEAEVFELLDDLGLPPSHLVDSGHGRHAWWDLTAPQVFTTDERRDSFTHLSQRFGATVIELGRREGFHVDNVSDPARILRVPGTVNRKGDPRPVRLVETHPERRYTVAQIEDVLIAPKPAPPPPRRPQRPYRLDGRESPFEAFSRLMPWDRILEPFGFWLMYERGEVGYWHHPRSTTGHDSVSATTDAHGAPVLVVHSESAAAATHLPIGSGHRLTKPRTWAILNYGGDEGEAARALLRWARGAA